MRFLNDNIMARFLLVLFEVIFSVFCPIKSLFTLSLSVVLTEFFGEIVLEIEVFWLQATHLLND